MDRDQTSALLERYYRAFNNGDKEAVLQVFDEKCEFVDLTMGRTMKGTSELAGFIDDTWSLSPYFHIEPSEILIDGDRAAVQLLMSGARKVDKRGQPKRGYLWRIPSTSFFRFNESQIIWKADCWNSLAIPEQIGWWKTLPSLIRSRR